MRLLLPTVLLLAGCEVVTPTLPSAERPDSTAGISDVAVSDTPSDVLEDSAEDSDDDLSAISPDVFADAPAPNADALSDVPPGDDADADTRPDTASDAGPDALDPDVSDDCLPGSPCRPLPIGRLPFSDSRDTRDGPADSWDSYGCAPDTDESGPEWVYRIDIAEAGTLVASVSGAASADPDVHILHSLDPDDCLARGHTEATARVDEGTYFIVVDTWVDGDGVEFGGVFQLDVRLNIVTNGNCAVETSDIQMFWRTCASTVDCYEVDGERFLRMPATGPVVREAHLVTTDEAFPADWPASSREGLDAHYALSERATGYAMDRGEAWAPAGEGGSRWGQGSTGAPVPVLDEAWYVNMYWRTRPRAGTRIIVTNPSNGRAVVASGGFETGPGANTAIGGAVEEIHHYLGTTHLSTLTFGFAVDQGLPLGPIVCD